MLVRYSVAHHFFCRSVWCSAFVLLFMSFNLSAKVYIESDALVYQGEISKQNNLDAFTFYQDASVKPSVLVITSGGGNIDLGMDLGEFVLEHNLDVRVDTFCFSSCANYVFTAGNNISEFTQDLRDIGKFRTPSLLGVSKTGPWMHNGLFTQFKPMIEQYNAGVFRPTPKGKKAQDPLHPSTTTLIEPLGLSNDEIDALVAFLEIL